MANEKFAAPAAHTQLWRSKMGNLYLDQFMSKFEFEGLTFDDISLLTQYADFLPDQADISTYFSKNIKLNVPFISAAMDTVTESEMAIAMAKLGGIGVIHKNLTPALQADEVRKVKQYLNGLIRKPVVFDENATLGEMLKEKTEKQYSFSGFPIVNSDGKLVGILTSRDIKFLTDYSQKLKDVMTTQLVTAPTGTQLEEAFDIMRKNKVGKLPIVDKEGNLRGLYSFQDVSTLIEKEEPAYNRDSEHRLRVAAAISPYDYERAAALAEADVDALVIDTAHGHSKGVIETIRLFKKEYPELDIVAGNIATAAAAEALVEAGADAIKVGYRTRFHLHDACCRRCRHSAGDGCLSGGQGGRRQSADHCGRWNQAVRRCCESFGGRRIVRHDGIGSRGNTGKPRRKNHSPRKTFRCLPRHGQP